MVLIGDELLTEQAKREQTLYLRLPSQDEVLYPKVCAILNMFPGGSKVVLYFEDSKQRRGTASDLDSRMLTELKQILGQENVVIK